MRSTQIVLAFAPLLALAQDESSTWAGDATTGYYSETAATEIPVTEFLSEYYGTAVPTGATGAVATSLASALYRSVEDYPQLELRAQSDHTHCCSCATAFLHRPALFNIFKKIFEANARTKCSKQTAILGEDAYRSAANDVYNVIATRTDADEIFSSLDAVGFVQGGWTTAAWYSDVPADAQSELNSVITGFQAVETSVLGAASDATTTASGATASSTAGVTMVTSTQSDGSVATSTATRASGASASSSSTAGAQGARATGGAAAGLAAIIAVGAAVLY